MSKRAELVVFYNLDNNRDPAQVNKEVNAILDARPALFAVCEAVGYDLPNRNGYTKVRDRSTKSRANVAAYVETSAFGGDIAWHDLTETWSRTNPGATGQHEPRSFPTFKVGAMQAVVHHQPPKQCDNAQAAQQEGIDALAAVMTPKPDASAHQKKRPRLVVADFNLRKNEPGPGPTMLATDIDGAVAGSKIDAAVYRGECVISDVGYPSKFNGVALKSDHGHALRFTLAADADYWVT